MDHLSSLYHPEDLVLNHPEFVPLGGSRNSCVGLLIILVSQICCVVGSDDASIETCFDVALVTYEQITPVTEDWSLWGVIERQFSGVDGDELLSAIKGEDESTSCRVADILIIWD